MVFATTWRPLWGGRNTVTKTAQRISDAVRQDPILSVIGYIAEPWDIGPGGYQLGHFPPGSVEWNDRFRDTVRRFWRGDEGMLADLATCLLGSSDIFEHDGRCPDQRQLCSQSRRFPAGGFGELSRAS
ncbi:MAG: hypothetical protein R3F37_17710 [Candidatus Competibacteraceae bacterium]